MTHRFEIRKDWLGFSELDGAGPAGTEAIQQAVPLIAVMERHEDGQQLANLSHGRECAFPQSTCCVGLAWRGGGAQPHWRLPHYRLT